MLCYGTEGRGSSVLVTSVMDPQLSPVLCSQAQVTEAINSAVGCHYFPSRLQSLVVGALVAVW